MQNINMFHVILDMFYLLYVRCYKNLPVTLGSDIVTDRKIKKKKC